MEGQPSTRTDRMNKTKDKPGMSFIRKKMDPTFAELHGGRFEAYIKLSEKGVTLMGWADPFYPDPITPAHVITATRDALEAGNTHYTIPIGLLELRKAICKKLKHYNKMKVNAETEIIITPGSDTGLYYAMRPFLTAGNGDEVLNPDPSYANNFRNVSLMGAKSISVPLREESGFKLEISEFEKRLTDRTKMVVLTNPNNPTTTVYSRRNLTELSEFIIDNDLIVVTDQAFERTIFDNREMVSISTLPGMWERTISVFSISKDMGLSGLRVGYIVACEDIMDALYGGAVYILGATNTLAQVGACAAFENDSFINNFNQIYDRRRKFAYEAFNKIPGINCQLPESSFLLWLNVSKLGQSIDIANYLIDDAKVAVTPGVQYGMYGEGFLRISLGSLSDEQMNKDAIMRITKSLEKLSGNVRETLIKCS